MKLQILAAAQEEARAALDWYDDQRPGLGDEFISELNRGYAALRSSPQACSPVEDYTGRHELRCISLQRFPYLIIFRVLTAELIVVAVQHERRRPLYWVDRLQDAD
jgi:plasmid stabilization system protein ParE